MKNLIFGIVGCSGSGKSHIVNYVKSNFDLDVISILLQDNYYKRREDQKKDSDGNYNFDLPSSFLEDELFNDLKKIKNNSIVERLEYTFNNPKILPKKIIVKPRSIILVEGMFLFYYKNFQKLIDRKIFIDVDQNVGLKRRINRDLAERGYDPDFGARPLRRVIQNLIEDPLAEELLRGAFNAGDKVMIDCDGEEVTISARSPVKA